jgi:aspartyl protease family protein
MILWVVVLAALGGIVIALTRAFPGAVRGADDWSSVAYAVGFILLVVSGLSRIGRGGLAQHLRHVAIWGAIVAVLALGMAYRAELEGVSQRLRTLFSPAAPVTTADHEMVITQDDSGSFVVMGKVNGQPVRFLVDTGASDTALSPQDARRLGVDVDGLHYDREAETANGLGYGAPYVAQRLEVGPIRLDGFAMTINQAPMSNSLLGMSFLNKLESFHVGKGRLVLRWRGGAGDEP